VTDTADVVYRLVTARANEIAVNVGSNAQFINENKTIWLADQAYTAGSWGFTGRDVKTIYSEPPDQNVLGTLDDPLFQTMQENLTGYRFDVPAGSYKVDLLFAEMKIDKPGERVFSVKINGRKLLENVDLAQDPGPRRAFTREFRVNTPAGINIEFVPVKGKPVLSGIRIKRDPN
jgi:beta-galactosidase